MIRPEFENIKDYDQFQQYNWSRTELKDICKKHGLLFVGSEKKLRKVIEAYFNGDMIPPHRNWYTNELLLSFVNENGLSLKFDLFLFGVSLILTVLGIINGINYGVSAALLFLLFGAPGLFASFVSFNWSKDLEIIRSYGPVCGDKRFTRAEVDEQANSANTVNLGYEDILLAPNMLIGITAGIAAIAYEDIASLQVRQTWHTERIGLRGTEFFKYYTYKIIVKTQKGRKIAISNSKQEEAGIDLIRKGDREKEAGYAGDAVLKIYEHCLKYNPKVEILAMKKSSMAPDEAGQQITEGSGIKCSIEQAVQRQSITKISVDEDIKKRFIGFHLRRSLFFIWKTLLVSAIAGSILYVAIRFLNNVNGVFILSVFFLAPLYALYSLVSTLSSIHKDDIEFYYGEIAGRSDKGYHVKGVLNATLGYIKSMRPNAEPCVGDRVIVARLKDGYSLIADKYNYN
ncbi:MAG: hypothetical protein J6M66_02460 [Lachnospiraceae bacterium]|nr:hypothetical protein [Lachnospiraceae bacterium]